MFLNACKQTFHRSHMHMSQKVKGVLIWNLQHTIFIPNIFSDFQTFNNFSKTTICVSLSVILIIFTCYLAAPQPAVSFGQSKMFTSHLLKNVRLPGKNCYKQHLVTPTLNTFGFNCESFVVIHVVLIKGLDQKSSYFLYQNF